MCKAASFIIILSNGVHTALWSEDSDSHEYIIDEEYSLARLDDCRNIQLVRVEIVPPNNDFRVPLDEWEFSTDQDILPQWYDKFLAEDAVRKVLPQWLASKVVLPEQIIDVLDGYVFCVYGTVNKVWKGGTVNKVFNGGTVNEVLDGTVNKVLKGGTVNKVWRGGTVNEVWGGTVNKVLKGGTVNKVWNGTVNEVLDGTVNEVRNGTVNKVLNGGTVNKVLKGGTVNKVWDGTVNEVWSGTVNKVLKGGTVNKVWDGTVNEVWGGTVITYTKLDPKILKTANSVLVDRSGDSVVCYIGKCDL